MNRSLNWMDAAACRGIDPTVFFPPGDNPRYTTARQICTTCPVRARCLDFAESFEQGSCAAEGRRTGMWGGLSPRARALRARQADAAGVISTRRENVLRLYALGLSSKEIADRLQCHERTVMRITKPVRDQQQAVAS